MAQPRRLGRYVASLLALAILSVALLALIPRDTFPARVGFWGAVVAAAFGFFVVSRLTATMAKPILRYVIPCALVAALKLAWGAYAWDTHWYSLADQSVRSDLEFSEIYFERRADTAVLDELLHLFDTQGLAYYGPSAADLSINNRPPAHIVAIVARAFGGQYAAYFPFVAWVVGLASLAVIAALIAAGVAGPPLQLGAWIAILWPMGWGVGSVMKDTLLVAIVGLCGAWMSIQSVQRKPVLPAVLAAAILVPPFRPAYAIVCAGILMLAAFRKHDGPVVKLVGAVVIAVAWAVLMPAVEFTAKLDSYRAIEQDRSPVLAVPVLGPIAYAFGTPFPWTQVFDVWWKQTYLWIFASQIVTGAMFILFLRRGRALVNEETDYGALLGAGLVIGGIASPVIQPEYVQAGTIAVFPLVMRHAGYQMGRSLVLSACVYIGANAVWLAVR